MLGRTHFMGGALAGLTLAKSMGLPLGEVWAVTGIAGFSALLPDVDTPKSTAGNVLFPLAFVLNRFLGHRGATHSLLAVLVLALAGAFIPGVKTIYLLAFVVGYLSHILLDFLNPEGVPLLYPYGGRFSLGLFTTGTI